MCQVLFIHYFIKPGYNNIRLPPSSPVDMMDLDRAAYAGSCRPAQPWASAEGPVAMVTSTDLGQEEVMRGLGVAQMWERMGARDFKRQESLGVPHLHFASQCVPTPS